MGGSLTDTTRQPYREMEVRPAQPSKIVQISATSGYGVYALDDSGRVWWRKTDKMNWLPVPKEG